MPIDLQSFSNQASIADMLGARGATVKVENEHIVLGKKSHRGRLIQWILFGGNERNEAKKTMQAFQKALTQKYGNHIAQETVRQVRKQTGNVFVAKHIQQSVAVAERMSALLREERTDKVLATPETQTKVQEEVRSETQTEAKPEASPKAQAEGQLEAKPETQPEMQSETQPEAQIEAQTEIKSEAQPKASPNISDLPTAQRATENIQSQIENIRRKIEMAQSEIKNSESPTENTFGKTRLDKDNAPIAHQFATQAEQAEQAEIEKGQTTATSKQEQALPQDAHKLPHLYNPFQPKRDQTPSKTKTLRKGIRKNQNATTHPMTEKTNSSSSKPHLANKNTKQASPANKQENEAHKLHHLYNPFQPEARQLTSSSQDFTAEKKLP